MADPSGRRKGDGVDPAAMRIRLLAVDDDRPYLNYLSLILGRGGFDVTLAGDSEAAMKALRADPGIELLLIDLAMPEVDGLETHRRIQQEFGAASYYTILLTAHAGIENKLRAFESGFDDFLAKSESEEAIVAKLRSAARRVELERQLHLENQKLQTLAYTDDLTGTANRRALLRAAAELAIGERQFSVVLFDLDRFKEINDRHGHSMGDQVLAGVAACMKAKTRVGDVIGRYGGDEFVILLAGADLEEGEVIASRIAQGIAGLEWHTDREAVHVTASYGVSEGNGVLLESLRECDARLYVAKEPREQRGGAVAPPPGKARPTVR